MSLTKILDEKQQRTRKCLSSVGRTWINQEKIKTESRLIDIIELNTFLRRLAYIVPINVKFVNRVKFEQKWKPIDSSIHRLAYFYFQIIREVVSLSFSLIKAMNSNPLVSFSHYLFKPKMAGPITRDFTLKLIF